MKSRSNVLMKSFLFGFKNENMPSQVTKRTCEQHGLGEQNSSQAPLLRNVFIKALSRILRACEKSLKDCHLDWCLLHGFFSFVYFRKNSVVSIEVDGKNQWTVGYLNVNENGSATS